MRKFMLVTAGILLATAQLAVVGFGFAGTALAAGCTPVGLYTAAVVAVTGQVITGTIDAGASGCDFGVYVGPGVTHVTIAGATISGAHYEGILVQDASLVAIRDNTVTGNAVSVPPELGPETKGIEVVGSNHVNIVENMVTHNLGGGIGVSDDGGFNPGAPRLPGATLPGHNNTIIGNHVLYNGNPETGGCGIVVASYDPGAGVANNLIMGNVVRYNPAGIIVAADAPNTTATNNAVLGNTSTDNGYAGIIVHGNSAGDVVSNTQVVGNTVSDNHPYGIVVAAGDPSATLTSTTVVFNRISNEIMGIGHFGDTNTAIAANFFTNVVTNVGTAH